MFLGIFKNEGAQPEIESIRIVSTTQAFETPAVWDSQKLKDEMIAYQALMAYVAADGAATDPRLRVGIIDNINQILGSECGIKFLSREELETFIEEYILLTS